MGITYIINNSNVVVNLALCVWLSYYEANEVMPQSQTSWDKVGAVWFSVPIVPWYNREDGFAMGSICSWTYSAYTEKAKSAAQDIEKNGHGEIGYMKIIGRNLTYNQAEDRLLKLAYWGNGYYVSDKTITITGGPQASAVTDQSIDITDSFEKIDMYLS